MAPSMSFFSLICLLTSCGTLVRGASLELDAARCSFLPEPDLVNSFLLQNYSDWTNPLLEEQPQPLQLIRCRSFNTSGHCYDFYQSQTPSQACERPPPLLTFGHHRHVPLKGSWFWHPWTVATFLSLSSFGALLVVAASLVLIGAIGVPGWLIFFFWKELTDGLTLGEPFVPEKNEGIYLVQMFSDDKHFVRTHNQVPSQKLEEEVREGKQVWGSLISKSGLAALKVLTPETGGRIKKGLGQTGDCLFFTVIVIVGFAGFAAFLAVPPLEAADNTPGALKCLYPEIWVESVGPVRLPDPSQGLNNYLAFTPGASNLTLQLCTTKRLQFYVGSPSSCEEVGDSYAERLPVAEPKIDDGCPSAKYRSIVLFCVCVGSVCFLALCASCVLGCCCDSGRNKREAAYAAREIELEKLKDEDDAESQA